MTHRKYKKHDIVHFGQKELRVHPIFYTSLAIGSAVGLLPGLEFNKNKKELGSGRPANRDPVTAMTASNSADINTTTSPDEREGDAPAAQTQHRNRHT